MDWTNNFTALWVNSADDIDDIFLISFSQKKKKKKKKIALTYIGDNLHEISKPFFLEDNRKLFLYVV